MGVTLPYTQVKQLLHDNSSTVARYSLGLIPASASKSALLKVAGSCVHTNDPAFNEELDILRKLVFSEQQNRLECIGRPPSETSQQENSIADQKQTAIL